MTERSELSIIIPVFNEEGNILPMAHDMASCLDVLVGIGKWHFVLVNNGSTDTSEAEINDIISMWPSSLKVYLKKADYGEALKAGLERAETDWCFLINVDFYDIVFLEWSWRMRKKYDIIIGSKMADPFLDKRPPYRKILSWGLNSILKIYFGFVGTDTHGQKLINQKAMRGVIDACVMRRGQFDTEMLLRAQRLGYKTAEFPVPIHEVRKQRNLMIQKIIRNLVDIWRMKKVLKRIPFTVSVHHHAYSRKNMNVDS